MKEPDVTFYGPDGSAVTDPARAAAIEVQEYDEQGVPSGRTYLERDPGTIAWATTDEDEDVVAAGDDTGKGTWDLYDPETYEPVTTREQLVRALAAGPDVAEQRVALAGQIEVPSWQVAPQALKDEVYAWLEATRPTPAGGSS